MSARAYLRTAAREAHERLMQQLTVHTHEAKPRPPADMREPFAGGQNGKPPPVIVAARRERVRALLIAGQSTRAIAAREHVSRVAIQKHRRALLASGELKK